MDRVEDVTAPWLGVLFQNHEKMRPAMAKLKKPQSLRIAGLTIPAHQNPQDRRQGKTAEGAQPSDDAGSAATALGVNRGTSLNTAALATPMPSASSIWPAKAAAIDAPPRRSPKTPPQPPQTTAGYQQASEFIRSDPAENRRMLAEREKAAVRSPPGRG